MISLGFLWITTYPYLLILLWWRMGKTNRWLFQRQQIFLGRVIRLEYGRSRYPWSHLYGAGVRLLLFFRFLHLTQKREEHRLDIVSMIVAKRVLIQVAL